MAVEQIDPMPNGATSEALTSVHSSVPIPIYRAEERVTARGKFLFLGDEKFWIKGVTYGTFAPNSEGDQFPSPEQVEEDFVQIKACGINTIRTYTPPPKWLLDCAQKHGLVVMIGLAWEQHVAFLRESGSPSGIAARVRKFAENCAGHPAILCYAVGNEIPSSIVRWYGRQKIERFIKRLYKVVKREDPDVLVTYVNYPTTEYLQLPFLDFYCFNVYLESRETLSAYLARLQNLAGEKPLVLAEVGLDSRRNGEEIQAEKISWQLETVFGAGCAGAFVFSWTDEWYRGGHDIKDWDFGIVTRDRKPKPALGAVREAYRSVPFSNDTDWPRISVVVATYNGARTIRDTLEGLKRLEYPSYEVIVVGDGSTDKTVEIVREYDVRFIHTENRGLSNARNTGWQEAHGEIIAYIDDDAYPDRHWLHYIAYAFLNSDHVGIGGPNIAPEGDGEIAECIANAPGGPVHVLISDTEAEHIPGCNMAFKRSALEAIGGFDPRYRAAGDDVDLCWRLMDQGWTIGFHAGALDWHHRRNSIKDYWRQQKGYGKAEALLEEKWPERYNTLGHLAWKGRPYGRGLTEALCLRRWQVYQGTWGTAAYQSLYERAPSTWLSFSLMPEWYLLVIALGLVTLIGISWPPLAMMAGPLLVLSVLMPIGQAVMAAMRASFPSKTSSGVEWKKRVLTAVLHLLQPAARLWGRLQHGLTPWRKRGKVKLASPFPKVKTLWSENWREPHSWVEQLETALSEGRSIHMRGGDFDHWDLKIHGGVFGVARTVLAVEEHGAGKQLIRFAMRPDVPPLAIGLMAVLLGLAAISYADGVPVASAMLSIPSAVLAVMILRDCATAAGAWDEAVKRVVGDGKAPD